MQDVSKHTVIYSKISQSKWNNIFNPKTMATSASNPSIGISGKGKRTKKPKAKKTSTIKTRKSTKKSYK